MAQPNITATYHFRPIGNVNWGNQNSSGIVNGNLSLTIPFLTTVVNVNSTAFWYSLTGVIGLASVSAFIYFFRQTTTVNGISYPSPNMKVKLEGTTTANVNITLLFRNLHLVAVLRQIGDCEFDFKAVGFSWCDVTNVPVAFNPVFNATVLSVTFVVPAGSFKIDPTTIGTSTSNKATQVNPQRKVFFCQTRYWAFYSDGTNIVKQTSTDGTTWDTKVTIRAGIVGRSFSTWNDCANTKIYYAFADGSTTTFKHRSATLNTDGTLTYDYAEVSITSTTTASDSPAITKDTSAILWIAVNTFASSTPHLEIWKCTISGTNCGTAGNWANSLAFTLTGIAAVLSAPSFVPLTSGKLSIVYFRATNNAQIGIRTYSGTTWNSEVLTTTSYTTSAYSTVAISDTTYFIGTSFASNPVIFWKCAYPCSSTPTETSIGTTTTTTDATISSNNNQEIVIAYDTGGASTSIFYKISTNGGTSFGSEQTLVSSESVSIATSLTMTYTKQNNCYEFLWTSNSGFNVRFQCLTTITNFDHTVSVTEVLSPTLKQDITSKPSVNEIITATLSQALTSTLSTTVSLVATLTQDITSLLSATITLVATINAIQATVIIQQALPLLIGAIIVAFAFIGILLPGRRRRR